MTALLAAWEIVKRIFGLLPPKVWVAIGAVTLILVYHFYALHERGVQEYARGKTDATAQCTAEKKAAQADYDRRAKEAEDRNKAHEQQQATELAVAGENYAAQLHEAQAQRDRDVAAARSGALKLRVAGMCSNASGDRATPEASTPAGQRDGPSICELPAETTRRLFELAYDADATVNQLSSCQAVITTYQKGQS